MCGCGGIAKAKPKYPADASSEYNNLRICQNPRPLGPIRKDLQRLLIGYSYLTLKEGSKVKSYDTKIILVYVPIGCFGISNFKNNKQDIFTFKSYP